MNHIQIVCHVSFLIFVIFTGALFFGGGDLLLIFFALTTANLCLILAATTCNSPYAAMGANREMLQTMAYEPMVLLTAVGFYLATDSFKVSDIVRSSGLPPIVYLPGVFCGFLFILTIKLRKHPFDLSTSHHAHQEMVKGLTTEFNGVTLLIVEVSHWYENVFLMGIIALFFINGKPWSYALAAVAVVLSYFLEILIDNTNARLKWQRMFKTTWAVTMIIGVINIFVLQVLKGGISMPNVTKSPWIMHYDGTSCNGCDIEVLACLTPLYDVERFGVINTGNPKHADILLITGSVNHQNAPVVRQIYEQMNEPKVVCAIGVCACNGGVFKDCYNVLGGVDKVIPVDIYVPGCAARPESIIDGVVQSLALLQEKSERRKEAAE